MEEPGGWIRGPGSKGGGWVGEKHFLRAAEAPATFLALSHPMDPAEYTKLAQVEADHWYYAGKREIVRHWILRERPPAPTDALLDCGAGTGLFAQEMSAHCQVRVLDDHEEALQILRTRFRPDQILSLAGDRVPLPDGSLEYVTALDVLEHVPDDAAVVRGFHRLLKPGGLAVVTVPASRALWSDWDVVLHHFRRYDRRQLGALFPDSEWETVQLAYTNVFVYPAVWLVRRWRGWFPPAAGGDRSEDKLPSPWLNAILRRMFVAPACVRFPWPFGVSLLLVARRR